MMTINSDSVLHAIQLVNEKMDFCLGALNETTVAFVKNTLDSLSRLEQITSVEKAALSALVSRISDLPNLKESAEIKPLYEKIVNVVDQFFRNEFRLGNITETRDWCFLNMANNLEDTLSRNSRDREGLFLMVGSLVAEKMPWYDVNRVVETIDRIPRLERESVCSAVLSFIKEKEPVERSLTNVLTLASRIPPLERERVFDLVAHFVKKGGNLDYKIRVLRVIAEIPFLEREGICKIAESLLKEESNEESNYVLLVDVRAIPAEERESVCKAAAPLIKKIHERFYGDVLECLTKISSSERETICGLAISLVKEGMSGGDIACILKALALIDPLEREGVRDAARPFIKEWMSGNEVTSMLKALTLIDPLERNGVQVAAEPFIKERLTGGRVGDVLEIIGEIPISEREIFTQTITLLVDYDCPFNLLSLLRCLGQIPKEHRDLTFAYIEKITKYGNKPIAHYLLRILLTNIHSIEYQKAQRSLVFEEKKVKKQKNSESLGLYKILPSILPAKWIFVANQSREIASDVDRCIKELTIFLQKSRAKLKHYSHVLMQPYLLTVVALDKVFDMTAIRKLQLLSRVCSEEEPLKGLGFIRFLCSRREVEVLKRLPLETPIEELMLAFSESFLNDSFIHLSDIDGFEHKYLDLFENTRVPFAMDTYGNGLRTLGDEEVRKSFERLVRSVLKKTFDLERYDVDCNPHLKAIQEYDHQNRSSILEKWRALSFIQPVTAVSKSSQELSFSLEDFFKTKILEDNHGHVLGTGDQLPELSSFLRADQEGKIEILARVSEREEMESSEMRSKAEKLSMELILDLSLSKERQILKIKELIPMMAGLELENDLKALVTLLSPSEESSSLEMVELCKGWEDLLLAGTEVNGSCQRIDGTPGLNKCLLAYCLDGKNSMIAVKDQDGKIIARSILRLLWNQTEFKPVLFLDRLYSNHHPKDMEQAIQTAAKWCANELSLDLFTYEKDGYSIGGCIKSIGSCCPFEYADGAEGVMSSGIFTIRNARKIQLDRCR